MERKSFQAKTSIAPYRKKVAIRWLAIVLATTGVHAEGPLQERWRFDTGLHSSVNAVVGRIDDRVVIGVQGAYEENGTKRASVLAVNAHGELLWTAVHDESGGESQPGAYLQWIPASGDWGGSIVYSYVPANPETPGGAVVLDAVTGMPRQHLPNVTHFGNNNSVVADLDQDGVTDFLYADQRNLFRYATSDWSARWHSDTGVLFCWSLPALADLDSDGRDDIVFGSEYNNDDLSSSLIALNSAGQPVWRSDGHKEDLGSTPIFVADVDGDDTEELVKVGLDLEHRQNQEWNHIHVFDRTGALLRRIPFGCTGLTIGNLDTDPALEGVGMTNTRDGGHNGTRAIQCVDLVSGDVQWTTPVDRAYLDTNSPVMADIDGDGALEAVVGTGNPAGYARLSNSDPWGDLYVVSATGGIKQHLELPGWPVNTAFCDVDDDGTSELLVVIDGKPGWLALYDTRAPATRTDWPTPFGGPKRNGTVALPK
ncbi:MAG: hypothetical protein AMXMBFR82_08170 [Candidatus Hydrogenedentota bacterium]